MAGALDLQSGAITAGCAAAGGVAVPELPALLWTVLKRDWSCLGKLSRAGVRHCHCSGAVKELEEVMCKAKELQPVWSWQGQEEEEDEALTDAAPPVFMQLVPDVTATLERAWLVLARVFTATVVCRALIHICKTRGHSSGTGTGTEAQTGLAMQQQLAGAIPSAKYVKPSTLKMELNPLRD